MSLMRPSFAVFALLAATLAACSAGEIGDSTTSTEAQELNEKKSLGMTDVTVLWPLAKNWDEVDDLMAPSSEGDRGELMPADLFTQLVSVPAPAMLTFDNKSVDPKKSLFADWADDFAYVRIVGMRLDPCFGQSQNMGNASCMNTLRLVAQFYAPRDVQRSNGNSALIDGRVSVHLFYQLTRQELTALSKALLALRLQSKLPLQKGLLGSTNGVHPTMAAEGLRGPYATALKDLVLQYAGAQNLVQVAFCAQDRNNQQTAGYYNQGRNPDTRWVFGRYQVQSGTLQPLPVAATDYTGLQTIDSVPSPQGRDAVVVAPKTKAADDILPLLNAVSDPVAREKARVAAVKFQNPLAYTANTADCVSCHAAKQTVPLHAADPNDYKSSTYRLDRSHDLVGPFRMFGYEGQNQPVVAGRVVSETAVVLDYMNSVVMK
jgi:hypothetical protein